MIVYFFDELEKIAISKELLQRAAKKASEKGQAVLAQTGLSAVRLGDLAKPHFDQAKRFRSAALKKWKTEALKGVK